MPVFLALLVSDEAVFITTKLLALLEVRERIDVIFDMDDLLPLRLESSLLVAVDEALQLGQLDFGIANSCQVRVLLLVDHWIML